MPLLTQGLEVGLKRRPLRSEITTMSRSPNSKLSPAGLLKTVGQGVVAFFRNDIEIKRDPSGVKVVLQAQPPKASKRGSDGEQAGTQRDTDELRLMRRQLGELLNELPETRTALRHLVFVERALGNHGLKSLQKLPVDVLEKALDQLESLVTNWSPVGLANLRSKMAVAVIEREHSGGTDLTPGAHRTESVIDSLPDEAVGPEPEGNENEDEALAAAYAALGHLAPVAAEVELQSELHSPSARGVGRDAARAFSNTLPPGEKIELRTLQP